MGTGPRPLRSLLTEVLAPLGLGPESPEGILRSRWSEAVGADVAALTAIERLEHGQLILLADNAVWRFELAMRRESIKSSLNSFLGGDAVSEVHVKLRRSDAGSR